MQLRDMSAAGLGRYDIGEYLGQGSSSDVFRVVDVFTKKTYVLKQVSLESLNEEEQLQVKKEIFVMNGVDHPNIVKFHESFSGTSSVNIVMEYCSTTLEELIERQGREVGKPFPANVIIEWMAELLSGLAYLHSRRIIHRDIKTSNIFLSEKNHAKLGDFGACTVLTTTSLAAHSMIGTPLYFSPEVCAEEGYDERSDVWSLGVVFYEMCTLRRPFEAEHLPGLIQQILTKNVSPFNVELDSRFEEIVLKMLVKNPCERPSAQDIIDNHLVLPQSHPSHPSQDPAKSRLVQECYGPELPSPTESKAVGSSAPSLGGNQLPKNEGKPRENGKRQEDDKRHDQLFLQNKRGNAVQEVCSPAKAAAGGNMCEGKKNDINKKKPGKIPGGLLNCEERMKALKRIKNAKSKINMVALREDMRRRRSENLGKLHGDHVNDIPVVVKLQDVRISEKANDTSSIELANKNRINSSPTSNFFEDISAVLNSYVSRGTKIGLSELEDAVLLLGQYKLANYGLS